MRRLHDVWVWDSWIADDGDRYHLFFLRAPRALGDPGLRHTAATIGHATSRDLVDWEVHDDALVGLALAAHRRPVGRHPAQLGPSKEGAVGQSRPVPLNVKAADWAKTKSLRIVTDWLN